MKTLMTFIFAAVCAASFAQCAGSTCSTEAKAACEGKSKVVAQATKEDCGACCGTAKKGCPEEEFMAIAKEMEMKAEAKAGKTACCKSTAAKTIAKGEKGCCNAKGELAKFKVFANGQYQFFGCQGSATKGRTEMIAKGVRAGKVQKVTSRVLMS
ncbi:MAG TPA: hypothetical protein PLO61_02515 [Fimbriimonadaceae bacterium]|nr:hypothetical protein [Fimbriimonadaceae bacterium]HRJ31982.1 hypothetical protein [Fimbriimonadaceae bacterium]